jgi:hypothetical protein
MPRIRRAIPRDRCPLPCRCATRRPAAGPARCPLPQDPLGPLPGTSVRALADLGLSPAEIARYADVAEPRVRAALRHGDVNGR